MYEQSVAREKRYLSGPKILAELTGSARRLVAGKTATWLSYNGGVRELLRHLRSCLGRPQISELSDYLNRYFKHSKRRPQETINDYVTRKCEVYLRAQQALRRVAPFHGGKRTTKETPASRPRLWTGSRRSSYDSGTETYPVENVTEVQSAAPVARATTAAVEDDDEEQETNQTSWGWGQDYEHSGSWNPSWYGYGYGTWSSWWQWPGSSSWGASSWKTDSDAGEDEMPELLPDYVQGWYLLQDAGLTTQERNVIQTALQGDFTVQRVAQELRNQWSGNELLRRDPANRHSSYLGDYQNEEDAEFDEDDENAEVNVEPLNDEGQELWDEAENEVQGAMAAIHQARRTLREARNRQHSVRLSRQYYQQGNKGAGAGRGHKGTRDDSAMTCLRCGKVGHRVANCPHPPTAQASTKAEATSSFICFSDTNQENVDAFAMGVTTTTEAVKQGKAVVDGGATRTLASIEAMEAIMKINEAKHGCTGLAELNMDEKPVFGFGNGSENRCASTAQLKIHANQQPGRLRVHCLDHGDGPLLLSVDSLRSLGAIIDFEHDLICFRKLDPKRLVRAERSATGHQLLDMTEDWYKDSVSTQTEVPSLASLANAGR